MSKKIAIIHTTPVTVAPLKELVNNIIPGAIVYNFVDDSILPELVESMDNKPYVFEKLLQYSKYAEKQGVDIILSACSSVGEFAKYAENKVKVPLVRIDEAMAEDAIKMGNHIFVVATLKTTLGPSYNLLMQKAGNNPDINIESVLLDKAYELLQEGKKEEHDRYIAENLKKLAQEGDAVVLAQASMANALKYIPEELHSKILTSTERAVKRVAQILKRD